jgi:hypothetical protein
VTPSSVAVGYQRFGGPCCLHLQGDKLHYIEVVVFWFVSPSSVAVGYQRFEDLAVYIFMAENEVEILWVVILKMGTSPLQNRIFY